MKLVLAAAVAARAMIAAQAFDQDAHGPVFSHVGFYIDLGALRSDGDDADVNGAVLRGGARFNRFVGAELEGALGVGSDDVGPNAEVKLDHEFGGYLVGFIPVGPNADIFGRVGFGMVEITLETTPSNLGGSDDVQTFNYGVGAQWFWDGVNGVRGDFTRMDIHDDEDFEGDGLNVWSIAYVRKFR